jgi:hypothetical protein
MKTPLLLTVMLLRAMAALCQTVPPDTTDSPEYQPLSVDHGKAASQPAPVWGSNRGDRYTILYVGGGVFAPVQAGHDVTTSFQYQTVDPNTGSKATQTFSGGVHGRFTSPIYLIDLVGLEFVNRHLDINTGFGLYEEAGGDHGVYVKAGYRYVIPLGRLLLKPGFDLDYFFGTALVMGSIDNRNKDIIVPGFEAGEQFEAQVTNWDNSTTTETFNADHLNVDYRRSGFLFNPKMVLAMRPRGRLSLSLEVGWMLQLAQQSDIVYMQEDGKEENNYILGKTRVAENGVFSGPYGAFTVGFVLWPKGSRK